VRTYLECVPCFAQQALDAARLVCDDATVHEQVVRRVMREISTMDLSQSPPAMGQRIHRLIRELTGTTDPYRAVKHRTTELALACLAEARRRVRSARDPLDAAVRMAIAGNIIDFGVGGELLDDTIHRTLDRATTTPLFGDPDAFAEEVRRARSVLFLADNAGEIVFDRVLIEELGAHRVTVAVRGRPVLNDALRSDVEAAGLTGVQILDNGSDAPGTILEDCTDTFRTRFLEADLVIAKGQGNYETLSEAPRPVWFALMAKCAVIARHIGCERGAFVLRPT
jgi:uncharacterized protein with ATP-grasp and redox domains